MSNGKGDWFRRVDQKRYGENFDRIFNKGKNHAPTPHPTCPVCGDPDCNNWKAGSAPAAETSSLSTGSGQTAREDVLGCDTEQ